MLVFKNLRRRCAEPMLAASGRGNTDYFSNDWPGDKKSNFSDFCLDSIGELPRKQNFPFDILKNAKEKTQ